MTPAQVHYGLADQIYQNRSQVLLNAYRRNPKRFKNQIPQPPRIPDAVWINKPKEEISIESELNFPNMVSHFH
jgi:putative transposase